MYRLEYRHLCALPLDFVTPYETRHAAKAQVPQGFIDLAGLVWISYWCRRGDSNSHVLANTRP